MIVDNAIKLTIIVAERSNINRDNKNKVIN